MATKAIKGVDEKKWAEFKAIAAKEDDTMGELFNEAVDVLAKQKSRSASYPLSRGSPTRIKLRGLQGIGNWGKRSKKGAKDWKRKVKATKRISIQFKCKTCGKIKGMRKAIRVSRVEIGEKVAK